MHVQSTKVSKNPHTEEASSITAPSFSHFKHFAIDAVILKNNLFKSKEITEGSIVTAIIIIAIIPHEFLISEILEVIVLKASFTVEPIIGIKLLIANFAVLIETLSVDCERILLQDKTNIKIDITKTVTPVKVFFNVLDIPFKS